MGKKGEQQDEPFVPYSQMRSAGHPLYCALDGVLREHGFDRYAETLCARFYHPVMGRPGLAPGSHSRSLLIDYFEGIDSGRYQPTLQGAVSRCKISGAFKARS
jgi:transposase